MCCNGPRGEEVGVAQMYRVLLLFVYCIRFALIQDPLCQIRLVIKIKSTGKSAESWRVFEKGLAVQSL